MRCWIISDKRWGDSNEERYEVEWQTKHPKYDALPEPERSNFDLADHPFHCREFTIEPRSSVAERRAAREEARTRAVAYAKSVAAESFFGVATVTRQVLEHIDGDAFEWTAAGDRASEEVAPD